MTLELVLARYKEPMDWLSDRVRGDAKVTIYNKSGVPVPGWISMENIPGSLEDYPYLHHIITNYDNLADWTFFAQANPFDHLQKFREIFNTFPESIPQAALSPATGVHFFSSVEPHQVEGFCYGVDWDKEARAIFSQLFTCVDILPEKLWFACAPQFAASRELLHTRTKLFYQKCLEVFFAMPIIPGSAFQGAQHPGPIQPPSAWVWERVWDLIWKPEYAQYVRY
jgi:hypothetical protein